MRACHCVVHIMRLPQLPFVLRAIKSTPLDDPEVRLIAFSCSRTIASGHVCFQVASHVGDILARTARLVTADYMQKPV